MNPAHRGAGRAWRLLRLPAAAWLAASVAACAQAPAPAPPSPAPEAEGTAPAPKLRGIKPAELPREEPGVGLGGLAHEPAQPVR
jgi:hypothetical protein